MLQKLDSNEQVCDIVCQLHCYKPLLDSLGYVCLSWDVNSVITNVHELPQTISVGI